MDEPLLSLAADDPVVAQVGEAVGPVLDLMRVAKPRPPPGISSRPSRSAPAHGKYALGGALLHGRKPDTFAGEQLDSAWADIDLDALNRITVPVLLTQGDQSPAFFSRIIARLAETMDSAEVRTLPGAGHVPHMTHPAEDLSVIDQFAAR